MRRVDLSAMLEAPVGCYTREATFVAWSYSPKLVGITYAARLGDENLPVYRRAVNLPFHADLQRPYRGVIDVSRVVDVGPGLFAMMTRHVQDMRAAGTIEKLAVIRPPGVVGAASFGLVVQFFAGLELAFLDDLPSALAYLGAEPAVVAEIAETIERALSPSPVDQVRDLLAADPKLDLAEVAKRLHTSTRALQRALQAEATTFRDETARGRFAHALRSLALTDDKIEVIAREAGYASAEGFARRVRADFGVTPSELRESLKPH